jgi:hypothetical protein
MVEIAQSNGVTMTAVYAGRKVAEVISEAELAELIDVSTKWGFELGKEHVTLLSTIEKAKPRKKWRNRMLNRNWSVEDFRDELKDEFGMRNNGAKSTVQMPKSAKEARWAIRRYSSRFKGLEEVLCGNPKKHPLIPPFELNERAKSILRTISSQFDQLEAAVADVEQESELALSQILEAVGRRS